MTHALQSTLPALLEPLDAGVVALVEASKSRNTRKAYAADWRHFEVWCLQMGEESIPARPETIARYLSALAMDRKPATLQRRLASISIAHQAAGYPSPAGAPLVRATMQGIRRTAGMVQRQAAPLMVEHIRRAVSLLDDSPHGLRDKALLLLGLAGAFRRSELVDLDAQSLEFREQGVIVALRRSKTNQDGQPETKDIGYGADEDTCPVRALRRWLDAAAITDGPVFRPMTRGGRVLPSRLRGRAVARIVKAAADRIGLSPEQFSGHSLRAGFVTQSYREGVPEADIMRHTGHRSRAVMGKYRREGERFLTNFTARVGL
ncbi:MAG: site-specific integrase [Candidatus Hydrogenedentes bacterium]|nr:site-specific integrase [Candidatus Hydrogenedentota bacterium]